MILIGVIWRQLQGEMDCVESDDLFVLLKPGTSLGREDFEAHPSFLRQAIVAACAAFETYLADRAEDEVRGCIRRKEPLPSRLAKVTMTVGQWDTINQGYQYKRRGITEVVLQDHLAKESSTAPSKVGQLLSLCGVDKGMAKLDTARQVKKGTTQSQLTVISDRRNAIAHSGDRVGRGRRKITSDEVEAYLSQLESIVQAIEAVFSAP